MHSKYFQTFLQSLEGQLDPQAWTYDAPSFHFLEGAERTEAIRLILARVHLYEPRAMLTAGAFKLQEALPTLEAASNDPRPFIRSCALMARARLSESDETVERLAQELSSAEASARINAAFALARMKRPDAALALLGVLDDPDPIVRAHAVDGYIAALDLRPLMPVCQAPLRVRFMRLYSHLKSIYKAEATGLRELFALLAKGTNPAGLGLVYDGGVDPQLVDRFVDAQGTPQYDLEAILSMHGHDRAWVEALTLVALERQDPGAPAAIAALQLPLGREALEEALSLPNLKPDFETAARNALAALGPHA